ncbi:MAG: DUF4167 domain-containing protein [Bradyrhizobium sp.]
MERMKAHSQRKPAAAQPRPNMKTATNTMPRRSQLRKGKTSRFLRSNAASPQDARRNYERYLALARAEALSGDRIAAENYFQHAEHYLRSMHENSH